MSPSYWDGIQTTEEYDRAVAQDVAKINKLVGASSLVPLDLELYAKQGIPPVDWIRTHLIAKREITLLGGRPGEGKSTFAAALAVSVSSGSPFLESPGGEEQPVMYFDGEAGDLETVRAFLRLGAPAPKLRVYSDRFSLSDPAMMKQIEQEIKTHQPVLVVFDSMATTMGVRDENNASEVTAAFEHLFRWRDEFGTSFLVVCHLNKPSADRNNNMDRLRGSTALSACASTVLFCEASAGAMDVTNIKARGRSKGYTVRAELHIDEPYWSLGCQDRPKESHAQNIANALLDAFPPDANIRRATLLEALWHIETDGRIISKALASLANQGLVEPVPDKKGWWRLVPSSHQETMRIWGS